MNDGSMIEHVSHAILKALHDTGDLAKAVDGDLSKCIVDSGLFDMRDIARAAVAAMRDPTEAMVDAVDGRPISASDGYTAMINAALTE